MLANSCNMGAKPEKPADPLRVVRAKTIFRDSSTPHGYDTEEDFNAEGELLNTPTRELSSPRHIRSRTQTYAPLPVRPVTVAKIDVTAKTISAIKNQANTVFHRSQRRRERSRLLTDPKVIAELQPTSPKNLAKLAVLKQLNLNLGAHVQVARIDLSDLEKHEPLFLATERLHNQRIAPESHQAKKNTYKLMRSVRKTKSLDATTEKKSLKPENLVHLIQSAAELEKQVVPKPIIKINYMRSSSQTSINEKGSMSLPRHIFFQSNSPVSNQTKLLYSIKGNNNAKIPVAPVENFSNLSKKKPGVTSRAERLWLWKGKKGQITNSQPR